MGVFVDAHLRLLQLLESTGQVQLSISVVFPQLDCVEAMWVASPCLSISCFLLKQKKNLITLLMCTGLSFTSWFCKIWTWQPQRHSLISYWQPIWQNWQQGAFSGAIAVHWGIVSWCKRQRRSSYVDLDGGLGCLDFNALTKMRLCCVYLFPCVQNTTCDSRHRCEL